MHDRPDLLSGDDLWGRVVWGAAAGLEEVAVRHDVGQAKVRNLDIPVRVKEQVLCVGKCVCAFVREVGVCAWALGVWVNDFFTRLCARVRACVGG